MRALTMLRSSHNPWLDTSSGTRSLLTRSDTTLLYTFLTALARANNSIICTGSTKTPASRLQSLNQSAKRPRHSRRDAHTSLAAPHVGGSPGRWCQRAWMQASPGKPETCCARQPGHRASSRGMLNRLHSYTYDHLTILQSEQTPLPTATTNNYYQLLLSLYY